MNKTRLSILKNSIIAALGLMLFALGVHLTIRASIGVAPWDVFCIGVSSTFGILYGTASIIISLTIIVIDLILGEKIGIGTILDAIVVGKTVDLLNYLDFVPTSESVWISLVMLLIAFVIEGFGQYIYMKVGLSCGPRDSLQIALGRRMPKIPIGVVNIFLLLAVLIIGYFLGGPVGIGTLLAPFGIGLMQQFAFNVMKFEPKDVKHQNILQSLHVIIGKEKNSVK